jgi:hypothetical protein
MEHSKKEETSSCARPEEPGNTVQKIRKHIDEFRKATPEEHKS